jgi:hypothetical protein
MQQRNITRHYVARAGFLKRNRILACKWCVVLAVALASSSCQAVLVRLGALAAVAAEPDLLSSRDNLLSRCRRPGSGAGA